jgi:molybdopterin-binding protein
MESVYKLKNIKRSYSDNPVLEDVNLEFGAGRIYALVGENGSGKTTLLETLAFLESPQSGDIEFNNKKIDFSKDLTVLRKTISFCMQNPLLFNSSVFDNIAFGLQIRKENMIPEKVKQISLTFGIAGLLGKKVSSLSGGEKQKTALARTFVLNSSVALLDEPAANLDEESIDYLYSYLNKIKKQGALVIMASHRLDQAYHLADEIITLKDKQAHPASFENFFSGNIVNLNGLHKIKINENVAFIITANQKKNAKVSINPKDIIISKGKFESSARNCLLGKVISIVDHGPVVKLVADCGIKLVTQITHKSLDELGINVGHKVYLTFKASSVKVY